MRIFIRHLWFGLFIALLANTSFAASFNCTKASTTIEQMVCADAELSHLDEELATAYSRSLKDASEKSSFKQQQLEWLQERNQCSDKKCVRHKYVRRINLLKTMFGCSHRNIISDLPKEIQELVPLDMGIEAISELKLADGIRLIAAIADPIWSFTYCGGDMPEYDSDARVLFVWREKKGQWKQIGKNSNVLHTITTGGVAKVSLFSENDIIYVQNTNRRFGQMFWSSQDYFHLGYDLATNRIIVTKWVSSSYNHELNFFADENQLKQYEEASKKYGNNVRLDVGYSGEIDFTLRTGTADIYKFPVPKKVITFEIPHGPINLDDFDGKPSGFHKLSYVPKSLSE